MDGGILVALEQAAHEVLEWVGFGTLTGLAAKGLMPGRDPGGAIGTMLMGIVGCVIGCGAVAFFVEGARVTPISMIGFVAATAGAFIILFVYRVLAGGFFTESEGDGTIHRGVRRRRYRKLARY